MESDIVKLTIMSTTKPALYTCLSPALLHLYDVSSSIVVIIDVLRATSTIATALYNGARHIIPVDSVAECIRIGKQIEGITASAYYHQWHQIVAHGFG
jgi:2-phosphosulfolactate phosphatase